MSYKIILLIIFLVTLTFPALAQWDYGFDFTKSGSAGLQFLKIGIGARETALGEAALGISKGLHSIFWNPAGIAYVEKRAAAFSYSQWLLDIDLNTAAVAININNFLVLGCSFIYMGIPEFEETTVKMQDGTGRMVNANDLAIGLAVARRFTDKLSMGAQVRYVREKLDHDEFDNVLLDIGAIYVTGFRHVTLGVAAQHFGPDIKMLEDRFRMPLIFKVGVADDLFHTQNHWLTLAIDLVHPTDNVEHLNAGLEYTFYDWLFLRSGYRFNYDLGKYSFGAGLKQKLIGIQSTLDYSFTDYGDIMGSINQLSISFGF